MLTNYFKIAWRNLMNNKTFSFINIFGLSIGLTCCLLIALYLNYELSYDKQHPDSAHIYQLGTTFVKEKEAHSMANTPARMGMLMQQEFPEIEETVRLLGLFGEDKALLRYNENNAPAVSFYENKGYLTDSGYFRFFKYAFTEGNPATALNNPNTMVLNDEIATKLFGKQPALNKIIHVSSGTNGESDVTVTGVFKKNLLPSHINGRFFMAFKGGAMERYTLQSTNLAYNNMFFTYLKLKKGTHAQQLESKFPAFVDKYAGNDLKAAGFYKKQFLTALTDIHLRARIPENVTPSGSLTYLYILGSVALFALLIACINFMNLSTARSSKRSTEVGIRKVLGANKSSLIRQFLGESLLMSVIAFVLAILFTQLCLPAFSTASGKDLHLSFTEHVWILAGFFVLSIVTGLLAGIYPAFYLSSFKPVRILKSKFASSLAAVSLRKGLVVFQFVISAILIISSVVISNQMHYMRSIDLGFNKAQQLIIPLRSESSKNAYRSLKAELSKLPDVASVGASQYYPGIFNPSDIGIYKEGKTVNNAQVTKLNTVDEDFIQTLDIKLVAGRLFSKAFPGDTARAIVLNEEAVTKLGFSSPEEAVGKSVYNDYGGSAHPLDIIGVVKNFNFQDLHLPISPFGFALNNRPSYNYLLVHTKTANLASLISRIDQQWHSLNLNEPFEYNFLDEEFQKNYAAQDRLASIIKYFTIIAILISCLGLFGLATFSAEQRTKEIGIRKVLGASVSNLVLLISKDFIKLVLVAIVLASPIAWWIMHKWLQDFAYRTSITWTVFAISGLMACLIAFITVSTQAIRAALSNPVKSLRSE
ncbi:MAG: FtsX-like permease family protein [Sediminibacterium sp.]|nr:FtsX-like permease family protein [Sediminibacterium sp.]